MTAIHISTKTALDLIAALNSPADVVEARRLTCILAKEMKGDLCEHPQAMGGRPRVSPSDMEQEITRLQKALSDQEKLLSEGRIAIAKIEGVRKELAKVLLKPSPDSPLGRIAGIIYAN